MLDFDDPSIAIPPLSANQRSAFFSREVDDRIGPHRRRIGSNLRERGSYKQLRCHKADTREHSNSHGRTFTT
jgi:hypothetical protein